MTETISRFGAQDPKPRPTHMLIVPFRGTLDRVITALLNEGEIFTVEPSLTEPDVWHVGCFESAVAIIVEQVANLREP